jgi:hypothetical protein
MIGVGLSATLSGGRKARVNLDPMPALDLNFAANRSLPADDGPTPSFSRASTGTYFNSSGVLTSAAVNVPRFDHVYSGGSWVSRGLLVEEQRTNLAKFSEDFSNAQWVKFQGAITANSGAAPDGNSSADLLYPATSGNYRAIYDNTVTTSNMVSIFAKANGKNFISIIKADGSDIAAWFNLSSGSVGTVIAGYTATIQNVGNGWYRCSLYVQTGNFSIIQFCVNDSDNSISVTKNGTDGVLIWGAQAESGSFPTSYIPSLSSSSTTRSADVCQITGTSFSSFWNASEGTLVADFDRIFVPSGYGGIVYSARDAGNNNAIYGFAETANEKLEMYSGGSPQFTFSFGSASAASVLVKTAVAYKANDFAASRNGGAVLTDTSGAVPVSPTFLAIGDTSSGSVNILNGHISRLRYYPTRLTNAQLQSLST